MKKLLIASVAAWIAATGSAAYAAGDGMHGMHMENAGAAHSPWGRPGKAGAVTRTVYVSMRDTMRFSPATIEVRQGETLRLVLRNEGKLAHEFVMGTPQQLQTHAAAMAQSPHMEHQDRSAVRVSPGRSGAIVWTFDKPSSFDFACLIAGHYQAGMMGKIAVNTAP